MKINTGPPKILLLAPLSPLSGYGNDGIGLAKYLDKMGFDVYLKPPHVAPPLDKQITDLFQKPLEAPFDLTIQHVDPMQTGIDPVTRKASNITLAWTMWERASLDDCKKKTTLKKRLKDFDFVVGYDENTTNGLRPYVSKESVLLKHQGGYDPEPWPVSEERDWFSERFGFCQLGDGGPRKAPFVSIKAFFELKQEHGSNFEGARMLMKTTNPTLHPAMEEWCPGLKIFCEMWPTDVVRKFYQTQHIILAPSRGEGKNVPALEMMTTGGTCIATNFSGHKEWLMNDIAYPLDYSLRRVDPRKWPDCVDADASIEHMKQLMWHTYNNRAEAKRKGELASQIIPQMCSWEAVIERLLLKLKDTEKGEAFWNRTRFM